MCLEIRRCVIILETYSHETSALAHVAEGTATGAPEVQHTDSADATPTSFGFDVVQPALVAVSLTKQGEVVENPNPAWAISDSSSDEAPVAPAAQPAPTSSSGHGSHETSQIGIPSSESVVQDKAWDISSDDEEISKVVRVAQPPPNTAVLVVGSSESKSVATLAGSSLCLFNTRRPT